MTSEDSGTGQESSGTSETADRPAAEDLPDGSGTTSGASDSDTQDDTASGGPAK